ncbi:hypothetical protein EJP82_00380 [Paenibacillus anaericanus]|uniref:Uncharacterized protein n=1 Tax=Paenibacillus anaericanus TaxID=170367 RepID=A0A433YEZ9_9BACL|nr:hypothetical protein [Paenibacillus anaericanus]RUT48440.1 hypothetical protein EJP82_00380 [Paenibacillus anaericanus]
MAPLDRNKKQNCKRSTPKSSLKSKNLEIIVASLLLTGKLKVDSIELFREASTVISLVGKFNTLGDLSNPNIGKMTQFLDENGGMTLDEVFAALKKKSGR